MDDVANLILVRSGDLTRTVVVIVTAVAGTAMGMRHCLLPHCRAVATGPVGLFEQTTFRAITTGHALFAVRT